MSEQYSTDPEIVIKWIMDCYQLDDGDWTQCIRDLCAFRDEQIQHLQSQLDEALEALEAERDAWIDTEGNAVSIADEFIAQFARQRIKAVNKILAKLKGD